MTNHSSSVFFSRENQNLFREIFWQFSGFHPLKNFSIRENIVKTARENTRCVRENFFQIIYVKMEMCVREKYNLLFPWNLAKFTFFCTREKKEISSVKIIKFRYSLPVTKKIHSWKNRKIRPWKKWTAPENFGKSVRECHLSFREKSKKKAKNGFQGHFWFSREKKTLKPFTT